MGGTIFLFFVLSQFVAYFTYTNMGAVMALKLAGVLTQTDLLAAIYEEEGVPVTKIAPRIGMEPNSLSRTLTTLEETGYLARKQDENDQRKVLVFLTAEGKKLRKIALKTVFDLEKKITEKLTPKQLKALRFFTGWNTAL